MKLSVFSPFLVAASAAYVLTASPLVAEASDFGKIAFVGDSITQGAGKNTGYGTDRSVSWRYPLWKIFMSNGVAWNPVGTTMIFVDGSSANASQTPNFRGNVYDNRNEGHYGWRTYDFLNGPQGRVANAGSGKLEEWLNDTSAYPAGTPDTVTLLLGVNDLSFHKTAAETAANAKTMIQLYQAKNPNVNVHVFSVLPSNQGSTWGGKPCAEAIKDYNAELKRQIDGGEWSTGTSKVLYHDISSGFDASAYTANDNLHPNAAGALIVAKNIASALGLKPIIDYGKTRKAADALATQTSFTKNGNTLKATAKTGVSEKDFSVEGAGAWTPAVGDASRVSLSSAKSATGYLKLANWLDGAGTSVRELRRILQRRILSTCALPICSMTARRQPARFTCGSTESLSATGLRERRLRA